MSVVSGKNTWQTGEVNGAPHSIEMCGSWTGHTVRAVAFCKDETTAVLLVNALKLLKEVDGNLHDCSPPSLQAEVSALLQRAGIIE